MHIDRKLEKYLVGDIDFSEFYLVSAEPVNDDYAVVFLAPKAIGPYKYFCVRYGHLTSHFFASIEGATKFAVECGYISNLKAKAINARYHPLICINHEEQHYAPSFPSDKKEQMQYFDFYLTRISNKTYQLCSNKPKTYSEYKDFIIDCPKCGEHLEIMGLATNYYLLSTYMCTNYKEDF